MAELAGMFALQPSDQQAIGLASGLLIVASMFAHGVGHILSSRAVGAPTTALILTATVGVTHFDDESNPGSRVHVVSSLGGPLLNLIVGAVLLIAGLLFDGAYLLLFAGVVNLVFGGFTLTPVPSLDGAVIFRELRNWKSASVRPSN